MKNNCSWKTFLWLFSAVVLAMNGLPKQANSASLRGNIIHDGSGTGLYEVFAFRALPTPLSGIDVRPTPGPYEIPGLSDGKYFLFSWKDLNGNLLPSTNEPFGWFGGPFPSPVTISGGQDVDGVDIPLVFHLFQTQLRGKVEYNGRQEGRIWIFPHFSPNLDISQIAGSPWTINEPGKEYLSFVFLPGAYYVSAFMDVNGNLQPDPGEPVGTLPNAVIVTTGGALIDDLDITLVDAAVAVEQSTWSQVKGLYSQ